MVMQVRYNITLLQVALYRCMPYTPPRIYNITLLQVALYRHFSDATASMLQINEAISNPDLRLPHSHLGSSTLRA